MTEAMRAIERFGALLERSRPPSGGVAPSAIEAEARSVLPLLEELPLEDRMEGDFSSFRFREAFTLLTLLGRRLALLDLTPTGAVEIVDLALASVLGPSDPKTDAFDQHARIAAFEGFVRGREERVAADADARSSRPVRPLRVASRTFALVVSGVHEPEAISEYVDALGRAMLDADACVGIVDMTQLGEPSRERARAVFAAEEVGRMLGASCIFSGVDPRWRSAATDGHVDLDKLTLAPTLEEALALAREMTESAEASANPKWRMLLERLRR